MRKLISLGVTVLAVATVSVTAWPGAVRARADTAHCTYATVGIGIVAPVCHRPGRHAG
ncbi:MAG TPA: hypothetical protein VGL20_20490 [Candidatus Dormibacteraeota bacterium]